MFAAACCCAVLATAQVPVDVDLSQYDPSSGIRIDRQGAQLKATWMSADDTRCEAVMNLVPGRPLFASLGAGDVTLAQNIQPQFIVTVGSRVERPGERYIFFDKPASRPAQTHAARLDLSAVRVDAAGKRVSLAFSGLSAGPFAGELVVRIYAGSPLLHIEAAMGVDQPQVAYIYDAVLDGDFQTAVWKDLRDEFVRMAMEGEPRPVAVRNRVIMAETEAGTLAVFPPPHAFFFPRDYSDNFRFAQYGKRRFGLRQDPAGGPGHRGQFIPWFDAPAGRIQRMGMFVLLSRQRPEPTLEAVQRYTHGDTFPPVAGHVTFSSHWHMRLTVSEMQGTSRAAEAVRIFKDMGVNIVHLAEFHGDGNPRDPGPRRLAELRAMFELCRHYSDNQLLLLPGEEANAHLNIPPPAGQPSGHWLYLFPKPVYLTLATIEGAPLVEQVVPYGTVYHPGNEEQMIEVLRREQALAWTAHPRIKSSWAAPDAYKHTDWYRSDLWLGGAWKAMPADLSDGRLGVRVLDLLDDMNNWGQRKHIVGEVDVFDIDRSHELYGHMNINYLRLAAMPTFDDWSDVLRALRRGDFFVTTGEVLIHSCELRGGKLAVDVEWTFPLSQVEIVTSDGTTAVRRTVGLPETTEFGRQSFEWPVELEGVKWLRCEVWDVAVNGAFTQPLWIR